MDSLAIFISNQISHLERNTVDLLILGRLSVPIVAMRDQCIGFVTWSISGKLTLGMNPELEPTFHFSTFGAIDI